MYLEKSEKVKINEVINFNFGQDLRTKIEEEFYSGDQGKVYDLNMKIANRQIRVLLFDTNFGRQRLLNGRFVYGKNARYIYKHCTATVARVLQKYFPDVLGYVEKAREHQILRAGSVMSLAPFVEGLKTQGDDFKRKPAPGDELFEAESTHDIKWGSETVRIFSDICPASGSTMEAFTQKLLSETQVEKIIFNCSTSTINALYRVIPQIPENIEVTVIYWEAFFSVFKKNVRLPDGEIIYGGTIINLNHDPDNPDCEPIAPRDVADYIFSLYQKDKVHLLPDIPGEVGEKIQDNWVNPITYDFMEFYNAGFDFTQTPMNNQIRAALELPGVKETLRKKIPHIYTDIASQLRQIRN